MLALLYSLDMVAIRRHKRPLLVNLRICLWNRKCGMNSCTSFLLLSLPIDAMRCTDPPRCLTMHVYIEGLFLNFGIQTSCCSWPLIWAWVTLRLCFINTKALTAYGMYAHTADHVGIVYEHMEEGSLESNILCHQ